MTSDPRATGERLMPVINVDALEYTRERRHGERFAARSADVAGRIGAMKLGYNVTRLEPGHASSPFHSHHVAEELFFILEGHGTLRFGDARHPVRAGDFIACPPGGADVAHQLIAGDDGELAFIAIGMRVDADIWTYPDSNKWGASGGRSWKAGEPVPQTTFAARYVKDGAESEYWVGE